MRGRHSPPVSFESGQIKKVLIRHACNRSLRHVIHLFAHKSTGQFLWAKTYCHVLRQKAKGHARALRSLGRRWIRIIRKMSQLRTCYDAQLHLKNQLAHGSWTLPLHPA
jgi:hypothetical protein